jgi:hypothetical protein
MMLRVREQGDELLIELTGVAGRQQRVLQALTECRQMRTAIDGVASPADVSVRAGASNMRIRLRSPSGPRLEAAAIYRCLRSALVEQPAVNAA